MFHRLWRAPALLLALATLFWSGNFVVGRAVQAAVPPVALAFWRWTGALLLVLVFAWPHLRQDLPALRRSWPLMLVLSGLGVAAFNTLVYLGLHSTTVTNGVLLQSTMPLLILLGSYLIFRERVRPVQLAAVAISLAGVVAIVAKGSLEVLREFAFNPGDALIFLAVCGYAVYSVLLRKRPEVRPLSFIAATFALGAAMLLPLYLWEHFRVEPLRPGGEALAAIGYVAVFPSLLSYLCFNRAVELIGANRTGQYLHLMPVFGSLLAWLFLGERLHGYHLAGIALIGAGIVLASRARPGSK
ncbi:MAG: DMT family transporter [Armatimonadota bacterium]